MAPSYKLAGYTIADLMELDLDRLEGRLREIEGQLTKNQQKVAHEVIKEVLLQLTFLPDVGPHYLTLVRPPASLSGDELQRIRLATQVGTGLVEIPYILDEPSIGLHQRDNRMLVGALKRFHNAQNMALVVGHDRDVVLAADYLIDMGPVAGCLGGRVTYQGPSSEIGDTCTPTRDYLTNRLVTLLPTSCQQPANDVWSRFKGRTGNNLKNVDVSISLGLFVCVTDVPRSGKSSLINGVLMPAAPQYLYCSKRAPLPYSFVEGLELIDKIASVGQSPLGHTSKSNPTTCTGLFSEICNLLAQVPGSRAQGYEPGCLSLNVEGGRCEECKDNGYKTISVNSLPDVIIPRDMCHDKRYNRETLGVRHRGKSIAEVLDMTPNQAIEFFEYVPALYCKLATLQRIGLGYVKLGQPSMILSGGENQRVKLATKLLKRDTGRILYILDEPTTGLHFEDIRVLLKLVNKLVDRGDMALIIEHNLDVIKSADYFIDTGLEDGRNSDELIFAGSFLEMAQRPDKQSYIAQHLKEEMQRAPKIELDKQASSASYSQTPIYLLDYGIDRS